MSGIVGLLHLDQSPVEHASVQRMVDMIAHRGPDGADIWLDGSVGLGHRMLWTTPESLHEKLPLQVGDYAITADARIDNRDELLHHLDFGGRPASEIADSEIILAAYQKWGEQCPGKLIGDFAFAIWDGSQQKLFCARDYFGVKPFYYYHVPHRFFAFASEMKALLCNPDVRRELNEIMLADYLSLAFEDEAITFYQDIFRLPSAHQLTVTQDQVQLKEYWHLDPTYELRLHSDQDYADRYRELFTEAVRCRLRSAFPVGTTLSGGLDSSSIACVARDLRQQTGGKPLPTFSFIFDEVPDSDERPFINAVLDQGGFEPHYVHGDQISPFDDFDRMVWHLDGAPFFAPQYFLHWNLWKTAQKSGIRVFLDGLIGDHTTSYGTGYLTELARNWHWLTLLRELQGGAPVWVSTTPTWKRLLSFVMLQSFKPLIPEQIMRAYRNYRWHNPNPSVWSSIPTIQPDFVRRMGLEARFDDFYKDRIDVGTERQMHYYLLASGIIPYGFEVIDGGISAFNIEPRYPFADRRLVEFCLALPPGVKFHNGYSRLIARNGLAHTLPETIRWRTSKGDLGPNFERSLITFEPDRLEQVFKNPIAQATNYINTTFIERTYERLKSQTTRLDLRHFWAAVIFDQTLRQRENFFSRVDRKEAIPANTLT